MSATGPTSGSRSAARTRMSVAMEWPISAGGPAMPGSARAASTTSSVWRTSWTVVPLDPASFGKASGDIGIALRP